MFRALFVAALLGLSPPANAASAQADALARAYDLRAMGDWDAARASVSGVGRDVIDWHWLRAGEGAFGDYQRFLAEHADWPGLPLLAQKGEASIPDNADPRAVVAYFDAYPPATGKGAVRLTEAYRALGQEGDAQAQAVLAWRSLVMEDEDAVALAARYGDILKPHHEVRMQMLLWAHEFGAAAAMTEVLPAGWDRLVEARRKLALTEDGVDDAIAAVPPSLAEDAGLAYERFMWRSRKGFHDSAVTLLLQRSASSESLGQPEAWEDKRRALARQMMRDGKAQIAYQAAARHHLAPDQDGYADLEWLAGYIALRYLDNPPLALDHFNRFRLSVATPISLGRAGYWEGRALEAMGAKPDAAAAYAYGARFQTSFYGLLAAERVGLPMDPGLVGGEVFPDYRTAAFMQSSVLKAALLLNEAGELTLSARFMRHLGESLDPTQLGQLADLALDTHPFLAVLVAKFAADQGVVLNRAYYPLHDLKDANLPVPPELALSIARRESEFRPDARSHAGARGLMQLMPGTGKLMAAELGISGFQTDDLTDDPVLNARLGSGYLKRLVDEFGPNYALVAAGYNAGPGRPRAWIERYGDPRSGSVDPVDWIEHIPYRETRNYVMRVMESMVIYRARLTGQTPAISLSKDLAAR